MSRAVASTCPSGGRRSTNRRTPSSRTYVRFERPPATSAAVGRPASSPGCSRSSHAVTATRSSPGSASDMCAMMARMPRTRVLTPLRWSDMDAYGHVNNVQFLRLLEDARVVAFAAAGSDEGGSVVETGLLVARSQIEYLEPLVYRTAPVAIDLWLTDLAGASFDLGYEVLDDDRVYARAETTLVLFDRLNDRPRRMTPAERERLEARRDEPGRWRAKRSRS